MTTRREERPEPTLLWLVECKLPWMTEEGWRPIETAPRDGTRVLIYACVRDPAHWIIGGDLPPFQCVTSYHPDGGWTVCEIREATHWRPLPAPPMRAAQPKVE